MNLTIMLQSEASVTDLNKAMDNSVQRSRGGGNSGASMELRQLFSLIPGGQGNDLSREMDGVENIRAQSQGKEGVPSYFIRYSLSIC